MIRGQSWYSPRWTIVLFVFGAVLAADLGLVAVAGTDIPFHDQWDAEGHWLFPAFVDGSLHFSDLFRPHNEHRIFWTHLLDLGIFSINGQWDPLVELAAAGLLRAGVAGGLAWRFAKGGDLGIGVFLAAIVAAFLPIASWHVALWGFETQVLFAVTLALVTVCLLASAERSFWRNVAGTVLGLAGLVAMGPVALVPFALLAISVIRGIEQRRIAWRGTWPMFVLMFLSLWLRPMTSGYSALHPTSFFEWLSATGRALAWPHTAQPMAAIVMNFPVIVIVIGRVWCRRVAAVDEDVVLAIGFWAIGVAMAIGWARGGGDELQMGVPSRYVDFLVLLPLVNGWCLARLVNESRHPTPKVRVISRLWWAFLLIGWLGVSVESFRGVILPRARDTSAPVRLARAFQLSGNPEVFANQPRLLVPHPSPAMVSAVLKDPRMQGVLPPSLQPDRPMGPLSRAVRWLLARHALMRDELSR